MHRHLVNFIRSVLLILPVIGSNAFALPTDRDQPVQVSANSARFNEKTGIATYTGTVLVKQGTMEIRADEIVITTDKTGAILSAIAKGNPAHYQQLNDPQKGPVMADAKLINYDARNEIITLTTEAKLRQDGSSFQGNVITYNSLRQQVDAKGDSTSRVQLVFPPQPRDTKTKATKK
jgi:lipopolysaccharide export system protein LptA